MLRMFQRVRPVTPFTNITEIFSHCWQATTRDDPYAIFIHESGYWTPNLDNIEDFQTRLRATNAEGLLFGDDAIFKSYEQVELFVGLYTNSHLAEGRFSIHTKLDIINGLARLTYRMDDIFANITW